MILVDTSVWAEHIRRGHARLAEALRCGEVGTHEFIVGELMLGFVKRHVAFLEQLGAIPVIGRADHEEVVRYVQRHALEGSGIGWVDAHILVAASVHGVPIWTVDRTLAAAADRAGVELV